MAARTPVPSVATPGFNGKAASVGIDQIPEFLTSKAILSIDIQEIAVQEGIEVQICPYADVGTIITPFTFLTGIPVLTVLPGTSRDP